jgi:phage shock protein A
MFKMLFTLVRGAAAAAEEEVMDRSALLILDQQIRDAASAVEHGKRALAVAIAHDEAEGKRLKATLARIADLEERAVAALAGGREDLAAEAAESIATMEADRDAFREARATFAREIAHLKRAAADAGRRLNELERGRRIAQAAEAVRRLKVRGTAASSGAQSLADAEATLRRLRERQAEEVAIDASMEALDTGYSADTIATRLEEAGFGKRTRSTAADVLDRLRKSAAPGPAPEAAPADWSYRRILVTEGIRRQGLELAI